MSELSSIIVNQQEPIADLGIEQLIQQAQENPPTPVIEGLLNEGETSGLHGPTEVFKTMLCLQLTEDLAKGQPFLGVWKTHKPQMIYFFETEMSVSTLGRRLLNMFAGKSLPQDVRFATEARLRQFKKTAGISAKFDLLNEWITEASADFLIIDTANPFFRHGESGSDETAAGEFFDCLDGVTARTKLFVRHNRKHRDDPDRPDRDSQSDEVERIKGSGQFAEVPDLLMQMSRKDKRTHEARFSITKYRHGSKPNDLTIWFDSGDFRLISIPPVAYLLRDGSEQTREQLIASLGSRFDVSQKYADAMILQVESFISKSQRGHQRAYRLDPDAVKDAEWFQRL